MYQGVVLLLELLKILIPFYLCKNYIIGFNLKTIFEFFINKLNNLAALNNIKVNKYNLNGFHLEHAKSEFLHIEYPILR